MWSRISAQGIRLGLLAFGPLLLVSCAADRPDTLPTSDLHTLQSRHVTIIYADPPEPLGVYVSQPTPPPLPDTPEVAAAVKGSGDSGGGAAIFLNGQWDVWTNVGSLALAAIIPSHMDRAAGRLKPYESLVSGLAVADEEFQVAHATLGQVQWLKDIPIQRVTLGSDSERAMEVATRAPGNQAVILVIPAPKLRDDANQLAVIYAVNMYLKEAYEPPGTSRALRYALLGGVWTAGRSQAYPTVDYSKFSQDEIMDKSIPTFFSDGGIAFKQHFDAALAAAKLEFADYFSGNRATSGSTSTAGR